MPQNLAEIVHPLIDNGMFENAEIAVKSLMSDYIFRQVKYHQSKIKKYEKRYGMKYDQFKIYLCERARMLPGKKAAHKSLMLEEEDALDWKIATEMMESWLGIKEKSLT